MEEPTRNVPFWSLFSRVARAGFPGEELLSVYRDYGVVEREGRDDNHNRLGADVSRYQLVEPGDLVVNKMKAWQGSLGVSEFRGIVSPAYFVYVPRHGANSRYLNYVLRSGPYIDLYAANSKGIRPAQWDLQPERLDQVRVPLPPLRIQRAIADYLDRETAEIDAMTADLDKMEKLLTERRRRAVSPDLSSYPCVPFWSLFHRVSRRGYSDEKLLSVYRERGVIERESWEENKNRVGKNLSNYQLVEPGDLAINKMKAWQGSLGVSALRGIVSPAYFVYKPHHKENSDYLNLVLRSSQMVMHYETNSKGIRPDQWDLQPERLEAMGVPLPSRDRQQIVVEHVLNETAEIDAMLADIMELRDLLAERRAAVIAAAVTGQIDIPTAEETTHA